MGEDQAGGHALTHDALEEPAESAAFPEATMAVLRERGMIRNGIFQTKPAEPAIGEIEVDFLTSSRPRIPHHQSCRVAASRWIGEVDRVETAISRTGRLYWPGERSGGACLFRESFGLLR